MTTDTKTRIANSMTPSEISHLQSFEFEHPSGQVFNLENLMIAWNLHVIELKKHTETGSGDLPYWGAHDLVAAVILRGFAARLYATIDEELEEKIGPILTEIDEDFISFTEQDEFDCVQAVDRNAGGPEGHSNPERGWWWHRIPTHGPIREDVRAYCNHDHH